MNDKKILIIINPVAGRGILRQKLWQILSLLNNSGFAPTVLFTKKKGDATEYAATCPEDYKTVICAGGDGTLNEVISGLMRNKHEHLLGYLPAGTTNDLATSLGLSKSMTQGTKDIIAGYYDTIDIGDFSGRYFNYTASFGAFTEASYNAPQEVKNILGHLAYIFQGIASLGNIRPYHVKFEFNGMTIEDDFLFGSVSNTISLGGILKLKETLVKLNDGKFEVLLIRDPKNPIGLQQIITDLISQNFSSGLVNLYHTSEISVETNEKIDWTLDGEHQCGSQKNIIKNIPHAVKLILPNPALKNQI